MDEQLLAAARTSVRMLERAWMDALQLRDGTTLFHELAPHLDGVPAQYIHQWWVTWIGVRARRLLDQDGDSSSLIGAMRTMAPHAVRLDADQIVQLWQAQGTDPGDRHTRSMAADALEAITPGGRMNADDVETMCESLRTRHRGVLRFVNRRVTHRDLREVDPVTIGEIEDLIDDALAATQRWGRLLSGKHLSDSRLDPHAAPMVTALRLFDWSEYLESRAAAERRLGLGAAPERYQELEDRVRIRFEWPELDEPGR